MLRVTSYLSVSFHSLRVFLFFCLFRGAVKEIIPHFQISVQLFGDVLGSRLRNVCENLHYKGG